MLQVQLKTSAGACCRCSHLRGKSSEVALPAAQGGLQLWRKQGRPAGAAVLPAEKARFLARTLAVHLGFKFVCTTAWKRAKSTTKRQGF